MVEEFRRLRSFGFISWLVKWKKIRDCESVNPTAIPSYQNIKHHPTLMHYKGIEIIVVWC